MVPFYSLFYLSESGLGISRYSYELYKELKNLEKEEKDFRIDRTNYRKVPFAGDIVSFMLRTLTEQFGKYEIIHNLSARPIIRPKSTIKPLLVSTAHDFSVLMHPEFYIDKNTNKKTKLWYYLVKLGLLYVRNKKYKNKSLRKEDYSSKCRVWCKR